MSLSLLGRIFAERKEDIPDSESKQASIPCEHACLLPGKSFRGEKPCFKLWL